MSKRVIGLTPVLTLWGGGHIDRHVWREVILYLRIWRDHSVQSAHIIVTAWCTARQPIYVCDWSPRGKDNSHLTKLPDGLSYGKIRRYIYSPPYVTARWPPLQIPPFKFSWCCHWHHAYGKVINPTWMNTAHHEKNVDRVGNTWVALSMLSKCFGYFSQQNFPYYIYHNC